MKHFSVLLAVLYAMLLPGIARAYTVNFDVDYDNAVVLLNPRTQEEITKLSKGVNTVEVTAEGAFKVQAAPGFVLSNITDPAGQVSEAFNNSLFVYFTSEADCAGKTWKVAVKPESEYYSAKFRLWVDRPEKIRCGIGFMREINNLVSGWNDVYFAPEQETSVYISPANIMDEIVSVEQDGVSVTPQSQYNLPLSNGTEIKVTTVYPEGNVKVKISFADPGTESFVTSLRVDDSEVPPSSYLSDNFEVPIGSRLVFAFDLDNYNSDMTCTVNGIGQSHVLVYELRVKEDTEIVFDPVPFRTLTKNINVTGGASHITVMYRTVPVALNDGDNVFEYKENHTTLVVSAKPGWKLTSVTQGDVDMIPDLQMWGNLTLAETGDIKIVVEEDIPDVVYVVYLDESVNLQEHMFTMGDVNGFVMATQPGYNHILGYSRELPLTFFWYTMEGKSEMYVNDVLSELPDDGGVYNFMLPVTNGDVVRIYVKETPTRHNVEIDNKSTVGVTAKRDYITPVSLDGPLSVFPATRMEFNAPEGKKFKIRIDDAEPEVTGSKTIVVNADTRISISDAEQSSIETIGTDAQDAPVYNLQGIRVGMSSEMNSLPAGIYITRGVKVVVR